VIITPNILKERAFQTVVKEYLTTENGYLEGTNQDYNRLYAVDETQLFVFLEETQQKSLGKLKEIYKGQYKQKILFRLDSELKRRGMVDILRKGIRDYGIQLNFAYFKPPTTLNQEITELYDKNRLSVTEELVHKEGERIDLVLFLNGLPVLAFELKNEFTGQDVQDAKHQWMHDRSGNDTLFRFKQRVIACFAMDTNEAFMTTKLNGIREKIREALEISGQRGIFVGDRPDPGISSRVFYQTDYTPYDWLFERSTAVIHHGGAGTTGKALRAGLPNIVVPFTSDQPFWGRLVYKLGAGPKPISPRKLTAARLALAIDSTINDQEVRSRVQMISEGLKYENGAAQAIKIIHDIVEKE